MSSPTWLEPLFDAAEQRELDRRTIQERGVPGLELMERAGRGLAAVSTGRCPDGRLVVVCGKGNNGGDGYVAARLLHEQGRQVTLMETAEPGALRGDARTNAERLPPGVKRAGPTDADAVLAEAAGVVDAILGTGFSDAPAGLAAGAIAAICGSSAREVIACDVPSGVDASTGEAPGAAVKATATASFHAAKPGLWVSPGKGYAGLVTVIDIGIPAELVAPAARAGLIDRYVVAELPSRSADSTKFAAGSVLVCGGSLGLTGAPTLACQSAMRAGAGYVTACVPGSLNLVFELRLLEAMSVSLPDQDGALQPAAADLVLERAGRAQALVLGPGLGRAEATQHFARDLARRADLPLVLDADGLNAHSGALPALAQRAAATVLTPHAGELARLLEVDSETVRAHRLSLVRQAAAQAQAVVVLKGDDTIVARPDGRVAISRGGAPALATAGTGDVLSGVIGAYLAAGVEPFTAACAAVLVHAEAGREAARQIGGEGVIAGDVVAALPAARARCAPQAR